jgi:hypothetical protein
VARGSTHARGYGSAHERERRRWVKRVDAGLATCARCHDPIEPGRPWDLGHNDTRTGWTGPEHRVCNRRAGGVNGAAVTNAARRVAVRQSRDW